MTSTNILHIASSALGATSNSRALAEKLIERFAQTSDVTVTEQDLPAEVALLDEATVFANFTPEEERTPVQVAQLAPGAALIEELLAADVLVISMPIYNFGPPASLKAWVDQIVRAGSTFAYGEYGPAGLLEDFPVYVVVTSGGVPLGAEVDFASPWIKVALGFVGLTNVTLIDATGTATDLEGSLARASNEIDNLALPVAT